MALHHCLFMIGNEGGVPDKSSLKIDESSVGLFFFIRTPLLVINHEEFLFASQ